MLSCSYYCISGRLGVAHQGSQQPRSIAEFGRLEHQLGQVLKSKASRLDVYVRLLFSLSINVSYPGHGLRCPMVEEGGQRTGQ